MAEFRRKRGFDYWHWCPECVFYPSDDFFIQNLATGTPLGKLCDECLTRDRLAACTGTFH
jgi:hypothetical protein